MKATITYTLSETGRRALLVAGGDGKPGQVATIEVAAGKSVV